MTTAITIWVIGWLYACGEHKGHSENAKGIQVSMSAAYAVLFFAWPHYLGYQPRNTK